MHLPFLAGLIDFLTFNTYSIRIQAAREPQVLVCDNIIMIAGDIADLKYPVNTIDRCARLQQWV